jgi:class 3 adenylate cyclase/tetratricopeptide (TPR) repeat protein
MVNRTGANFCKQCGSLLVGNCPRCRFDLPQGANYCDNCGLRLVESAGGNWWPPAPGAANDASARPPEVQPASPQPDNRPQSAVVPSATATAAVLMQPPHSSLPASLGPAGQLQQYVPADLLHRLESARATGEMVGERRVVTMLFCDVKGSTAAADQLDPEEWTEIMNGAFERMIKPVYAYEGTVARLMGDALLAFFGAPLAHEDDPQRAVLAGLDILAGIHPYREHVRQKWGIDFNVRAGINTGLVVVGAVGSDLRMEYSALGDAINLAARMEQTAAPGTVQIAHDTYRLVRNLFEFEELGGIEVKGKTEPIAAYRVLSRKAAAGRGRGIAGLESKMIGRDAELATLHTILADAKLGIGRVVCLLGEAGLGKSRIIAEARKQWGSASQGGHTTPPGRETTQAAGFAQVNWFELSCVSYESTRPYGMLHDFVRHINGIERSAPPNVVQEGLTALLALFPAERRARVAQVMGTLLGLPNEAGVPPLEGEAFKRELYEDMRSMWQQRFAGVPAVLVCDDMHWADAASIELLQRLLPIVAESPLVLLCSMRPDREAPAWQIKTTADAQLSHRYNELSLKPLPDADVRALLGALLGGAVLPEELQSRILDRAGGNPFFIEEVLRSLIDHGIIARDGSGTAWTVTAQAATFDIPDNLQALLTARIDRLEEHVRRTVQLASVVGRSFYYKVLAALEVDASKTTAELDRRLNALMRAEMIQEAARIPEVEYRFRNPLTQEIAYHTILLKRRRELHRQVAEALETLFPDRLAEHAARLGLHFAEAQKPEQALKYYVMAGDAAFQLYAHTEALQQYRQALAIALHDTGGREQITYLWLRIGRALELNSQFDGALANYREMEAAALERGDRALELAAVVAQGTLRSTVNPFFDFKDGEALSQKGLALARELGDGAAESKLNWNLVNLLRFTHRLQEAEEAGERSLAIARRLNLREQIAFTLNDMYYVYLGTGRLQQSLTVALEARGLWRELGNRVMLADSLSSTIMSHLLVGNLDTAIADSQEAFKLSQSTYNSWGMSFSRMFVAQAYWPRGEFTPAVASLQSSIENGDKSGFVAGQLFARAELGLVYALLGQYSRGLELIRPIVETAAYQNFQHMYFRSLLGHALLIAGDLAGAEAALEPLRTAERLDSFVEVNARRAWNALLLARGDNAQAEESVSGFLERLHTLGIQLIVPDMLLVLAQARLGLGQTDAARAALQEAQSKGESMGMRWTLWQIIAARAQVESKAGNTAEAQQFMAKARNGLTQLAEEIGDLGLRTSLLNRPVVRALFE